MGRPIQPLFAEDHQIRDLKAIVQRASSPQRIVLRARIVLARIDGIFQQEVAGRLGVQRVVVGKWE